MFNNDVTQNYNHQDATLEILVMLAGALLLGYLLSWLINKFFNQAKHTSKTTTYDHQNDDFVTLEDIDEKSKKNTSTHSFSSKEVKLTDTGTNNHYKSSSSDDVKGNNQPTEQVKPYTKPKIDQLTKISGITTELESQLRDNGIKSFTDLRDIDRQSLMETLNLSKDADISKDVQFWPHQASLAAKGEWNKLSEYQSFLKRTLDKTNSLQGGHTRQNNDNLLEKSDLKKIEGIGPKIEEILNARQISTYKDLMNSDRETLKSYLDKEGSRFEKNEPETWPLQAGMADRGEWEELKIYQEFMDDDTNFFIDDNDSSLNTTISNTNNDDDNSHNHGVHASDDSFSIKDDLKKIDGIGPKIQEILNNKGIHTYRDLHKSNSAAIKSYLDEAGPQFKLHDPESWPKQAGFAERGEWRKLDEYQDFMHGMREAAYEAEAEAEAEESNTSVQSVISAPFKNDTDTDTDTDELNTSNNDIKSTIDDLKKIEGVGPKIEELLHKAGINTFEKLKDCSSATIKDLLDTAGPQFKMHNPDTWPHQAKMAYKGEWGKLDEYQDFLLGGRE